MGVAHEAGNAIWQSTDILAKHESSPCWQNLFKNLVHIGLARHLEVWEVQQKRATFENGGRVGGGV